MTKAGERILQGAKEALDYAIKDQLEAEIIRLKKALEEIRDYGRVNCGMGYTCHKMALKALGENK